MRRVAVRPENARQSEVLRLLRDNGPVSRAELGEAVQLSRSKLALELERLTEIGLVEARGLAASRGGRRSTVVALADNLRFLGVDIGATSVDVAVTDARMTVLEQVSESVDVRTGPDNVLAVVLDLVGKLRAGGGAVEVYGAGVGVPGPVSFRDGVPVAPPIMPGWNQFPVRSVLSQHLGCPVLVDNDVNIMALGEMHAGLARTVDDLLFVKVGTGVGCGIVVDGQVYRGASGSAGDIGHIRVDDEGPVCSCGNVGCLEASLQRRGACAQRARDRTRRPLRPARRPARGLRNPHRGRRFRGSSGGRPGLGGARPRRRPAPGAAARRLGELLQPSHGRPGRRGGRRSRPPAARRNPQRRLPAVAAARDRQPTHRLVRNGFPSRRRRCRQNDLRLGAQP